jgi:hypothetical protein
MLVDLVWADFKNIIVDKARLRFIDRDSYYYLLYTDDGGTFESSVLKDGGADQIDFDSNYKALANAKPSASIVNIVSAPPFGSKTIIVNGVTKKLYARNVGFQQALSTGANTISYTASYTWVKMLGVEVINCEALDTVDFKVYDTVTGTYSGYANALLNQFSFTHNLPKDYYIRMAQFDADVYPGMIIQVGYNSISNKTVGINLIMNEVKS